MKNSKKEKKPSKFKAWRKKMKSTPKGRAYLKLIYWGIFFVFLFIFLAVAQLFRSDYDICKDGLNIKEPTNEVVPKTIEEMEQILLNGKYDYTYDIHIYDNSYLFDGTKYDTYQEGYLSVATTVNNTIPYYIDDTGIYQNNINGKVPITNLYDGLDTNIMNLEVLLSTMNNLTLIKDTHISSYSSYTCEDNTYIYTMNISPDGNTITDISVVSLDGNSTYLFTFVYEEDSYE